ncbi:MAG: hypothetical protein ACI9Y1_001763 [Lentisphaeria bacterium]|jgi:hypothetical protein
MNLNPWKLNGSISIWRYEPINRKIPGWHLIADNNRYDSLLGASIRVGIFIYLIIFKSKSSGVGLGLE